MAVLYWLARLAPAAQAHVLVPAVHGALRRADARRALALGLQAACLAAGRREAAQLAVLHGVLADPVDPRVLADDLVHRIHHDDLEPLVHGVGGDPVGVQDAQAAALAADALLRDALQVAGRLDVDAAGAGLTVHDALRDALLAAAALDAHTVDEVALLRLVAELARLVRTCGPRCAVDRRHLAKLPGPHTLQEAHHIGLLLAP